MPETRPGTGFTEVKDETGQGTLDFKSDQSLGYLNRVTYRAFQKALQRRISGFSVNTAQWTFLRLLWLEDGVSQRELAQRAGMLEPATTSTLKGMERDGLIERRRCDEDKRRILIHLTAKGGEACERILPLAMEVNELAAKDISAADIASFRRIIRQIMRNLNEEI